ncbi:MAG: SagB/ThcOx family dehydrogenase [bacterium]
MRRLLILAIALVLTIGLANAEEIKPIKLPSPRTEGGMPLMEALKARRSSRAFSEKEIPLDVLSDLLWAAFGINRPEEGKRTAPSARNWQEIDIYVAMKQGVYIYKAKTSTLEPVMAKDIRALTGVQPFVATAPINLIFVADFDRMGNASDEEKQFNSAADCGFISQNVYLFCASAGLATVVRGAIDRNALAKEMNLRKGQRIILAQTVGYPPDQ